MMSICILFIFAEKSLLKSTFVLCRKAEKKRKAEELRKKAQIAEFFREKRKRWQPCYRGYFSAVDLLYHKNGALLLELSCKTRKKIMLSAFS